jgi:hypothetical protein
VLNLRNGPTGTAVISPPAAAVGDFWGIDTLGKFVLAQGYSNIKIYTWLGSSWSAATTIANVAISGYSPQGVTQSTDGGFVYLYYYNFSTFDWYYDVFRRTGGSTLTLVQRLPVGVFCNFPSFDGKAFLARTGAGAGGTSDEWVFNGTTFVLTTVSVQTPDTHIYADPYTRVSAAGVVQSRNSGATTWTSSGATTIANVSANSIATVGTDSSNFMLISYQAANVYKLQSFTKTSAGAASNSFTVSPILFPIAGPTGKSLTGDPYFTVQARQVVSYDIPTPTIITTDQTSNQITGVRGGRIQ